MRFSCMLLAMSFFDVFQLIMMVLFFLVFFGRGVVMRRRGQAHAIPSNEGKKPLGLFIEKSFMLVWIAFAVYVTAYALHINWLMVPAALHAKILDSLIAQIAGVLLIVTGFLFFIGAMASMSESWRMGVDYRNPGDLVTTGAFEASRNPVFLFFDIYFIATFLINGTWFFLILAAYAISAIHYQILQEEKSLEKIHRATYLDYKSRIRRYL